MSRLWSVIWFCLFVPTSISMFGDYDYSESDSSEHISNEWGHDTFDLDSLEPSGPTEQDTHSHKHHPTSTDTTINPSLGEFCTTSEHCQRSVVDSECKEMTCVCKDGFVARGHIWCQHKESSADSRWNADVFSCDTTSCAEPPCQLLYSRKEEFSGYSLVSNAHQSVRPPCHHHVALQFHSLTLATDEVITVNYMCAGYFSDNDSFGIVHIKVQKPHGLDTDLDDKECMHRNHPCPKVFIPCTGDCPDRTTITDYMIGVREDCRPASKLEYIVSSAGPTSPCYAVPWLLLIYSVSNL